jgi:hypothetical protein
VTTYNKAIKVTVDGPREPRTKSRKFIRLAIFLSFYPCAFSQKSTTFDHTEPFGNPGVCIKAFIRIA